MKIAFNPSTVGALIAPPNNKDITFDLRGHNIFARGVKFCGTDTNTWRDIKINNVSIGSNILDLRDGDNTTLTNINGVVAINSTWRPVVDNLTSDSTTSSLSANQGRVLARLINTLSTNISNQYALRDGSNATGRWRGGLACLDVRDTNYTPYDLNMGLELHFFDNNTNNLKDGGEYNGVFSFRQWASGSDWSGGKAHQLSFTDNGNIWHRTSSGDDSWGTWKKLAYSTDIPSSLKSPYSLTTFGVVYDGSSAKTVTTSTFVSQLSEGTSTVTDGTMFITSWASDNGFADTNAVNVPYKRKAIHLWEYIKAKTDSLYATRGHNHDDRYLKLTGGTMSGTLSFSPTDASDAAPKIYSTVSDGLTSLNFEVSDDENDRFVFKINYWNDINNHANSERFIINWNNVISKAPITAPFFNGTSTSATKLQTPRTIWGQSFDGTGDVSGSLSGVGHIQFSADNSYSIGTTTSEAAHTYTRQVWARHLNASRVYTGDTNLYIGYSNTAQVKFYSGTKQSGDGSNERMTILTNGNVGIGTTSPQMKLHVNGNGIYLNSTATCGINMYSSHSESSISYKSSGGIRTVLGTYTNRTFLWNESIGEHVSILSSNGYFGIGTTNPSYKLSVGGDIGTGGNIYISHATNNNMNYNTSNPRIVFSENGDQAVGLVYTDYDSYRASKGLKVMDVDNNDTGNVWFEVQGYNYSSGYVKNGSSDSYVLLGGGGHKLESSLNVTYSKYLTGITLTGGNGNNKGYRLIFERTMGGWTINHGVWAIALRHSGRGTLNIGFDTTNSDGSTYTYNIRFLGSTASRESTPFRAFYNTSTKVFRIYWHYYDYTSGDIAVLRGNMEPYNGTWMTSLPNDVGTELAITCNMADQATNADTVDGYHASGLFTALSNSDNGISITVGGTTKSVSNISVNYASSAGNADTVDGYHASSLVKFYLSPMTNDAPADSAKSWFINTMPSASGAIVYNVPGSEKTIIAGKSSGAYGHMLQLNYDNTYLRVLRYYNGSWKSTDWEKISAGYADSAGSASKVYGQVGDTGSHELVRCDMNNDQFRIIAGSSGNNNGWAEIATADDGNEPIYVRQYTGVFSSVRRTLTLLDGSGNTTFPGSLSIGGQIIREGSGQTWVNGRNGALLRETSVAGYHTLWSLKTTNGSWDFGEYNAGNYWDNIPVLSYITDSNYNSGNNTPTYQIRFPLASGTVALTSNIPNPTNYYWANVKISASSSTTTSPTVHTLTATRVCAGHNPEIDNSISCSNWFRSSGDTGWYNTTYQGGWYMSDTSWIRAHNGVGIYTSGQIYSSSSIKMGNILLEHTDEINNSTNGGIHLNYRNSGNITLCYGGGNVGIGTPSPTYKLDVNGQVRASGFRHSSVNSDNYMLLAGGGYKSFGGDDSHPIFLGYLNLDHGNNGTISSSFYCLGYSVPFTYTRGGNYCRISIPDTSYQVFYIRAAIASVNYSGGGMDTWTGYRRGAGAWWLHCYVSSLNEVRVKGFRQANDNNDSWWGGNPLVSDNSGANRITVCIFGNVTFR